LTKNNGCKTGAKGSYAKLKTTVYSLKFGFHSFKRRQSPFQAIIVISFFNSQFYVFPDLLSENKLEAFFVRISRSLRFVDVTSRYLRFLASGLANFRSVWSSSPFCDEVASGQVDGQQGPGGQAGGKVFGQDIGQDLGQDLLAKILASEMFLNRKVLRDLIRLKLTRKLKLKRMLNLKLKLK
jgi:hypothetical protein